MTFWDKLWTVVTTGLIALLMFTALLGFSWWFSTGCNHVPPPPPPPPPSYRAIAFETAGVANPVVYLDGVGTVTGDATGYTLFPKVPYSLVFSFVTITAPGYQSYRQDGLCLGDWSETCTPGQKQFDITLTPARPPAPSRMALMTAQLTFQGLWLVCPDYPNGTPVFDVMLDVLSSACRQSFYAMKRAAGDKVIALAVSHAYYEQGIPAPISTGRDWSFDLPGLHTFLEEVIDNGFYIQLHLAGDGQSRDSIGWTYGYSWLTSAFPGIAATLADQSDYIRFAPGFDSVFYGWSPDQVAAFGHLFRTLLLNGVLGIEHDMGHIPLGEGGGDYLPGGRMQDYDFVMGEFPPDLLGDQVWQILGRMLLPYHRPPEQPAGDDPTPPFYLKDSPRGPRVYNCFEWNLYDWVRNRVSASQLNSDRARLRSMGCTVVG